MVVNPAHAAADPHEHLSHSIARSKEFMNTYDGPNAVKRNLHSSRLHSSPISPMEEGRRILGEADRFAKLCAHMRMDSTDAGILVTSSLSDLERMLAACGPAYAESAAHAAHSSMVHIVQRNALSRFNLMGALNAKSQLATHSHKWATEAQKRVAQADAIGGKLYSAIRAGSADTTALAEKYLSHLRAAVTHYNYAILNNPDKLRELSAGKNAAIAKIAAIETELIYKQKN